MPSTGALRDSVFSVIGLFSNRTLLYAVASTILLQLLVIYTPSLNGPFNTVPLGLDDWGDNISSCIHDADLC